MNNKEAIAALKWKVEYAKEIGEPYTDCVNVKALDLAVKALEADRWISVDDKLPEKNDFVLIYDGSDMFVAWYENEGMSEGWHSYDVTYDGFPPIIAWRPLPEPYDEESEDSE